MAIPVAHVAALPCSNPDRYACNNIYYAGFAEFHLMIPGDFLGCSSHLVKYSDALKELPDPSNLLEKNSLFQTPYQELIVERLDWGGESEPVIGCNDIPPLKKSSELGIMHQVGYQNISQDPNKDPVFLDQGSGGEPLAAGAYHCEVTGTDCDSTPRGIKSEPESPVSLRDGMVGYGVGGCTFSQALAAQPVLSRPFVPFQTSLETKLRARDRVSDGRAELSSLAKKRLRSKKSHGMIEKRYRQNLNEKIEHLRLRLPNQSKEQMGNGSRLNKAAVLTLAAQYIEELEARTRRLSDENFRLKAGVHPHAIMSPPLDH